MDSDKSNQSLSKKEFEKLKQKVGIASELNPENLASVLRALLQEDKEK